MSASELASDHAPLIAEAERALAAKRWQEADRACQRVLAKDPASRPALIGRVKAARGEGRTQAIVARCDEALRHFPRNLDLHRQAAEARLKMGHAVEAARILTAMQEIDPAAHDTLFVRSALARARRAHGEALEAAEALLRLKPGHELFERYRAQALFELGRAGEARACLDAALQAAPGTFSLLVESISLARQMGDHALSREHAALAAAMRPDDPRPWRWMGEALQGLGQLEEAECALLRALSIAPQDAGTAIVLARLFRALDRTEEAIGMFHRACRAEPGRASAWLGLADILERDGHPEAALDALVRAQAAGLKSHAGGLREVRLLDGLGRLEEGRRRFRQVAAEWPEEAEVRAAALERALQEGDFAAAEAAIATLPTKSSAQRTRRALAAGQLALRRFRPEEAVAAFAQAAQEPQAPRRVYTGLMLGHLMLLRTADSYAAQRQARLLHAEERRARGLPRGLFRNMMVALIEEARIDEASAEAARLALEREGLPGLLRVLRAAPEFTPAAIALNIELRRLGLLDAAAPGGGILVPRRIHQFWDAPRPPADVERLMASWTALNPGWLWRRYDREGALAWLRARGLDDTARAFRFARHQAAQQADIFRLAVLHVEGGVYADADDRCVAPLDQALGGAELVLRQEPTGLIGNNFIAAMSGHPVIARALERVTEAVLRGDSESIYVKTGPGAMTRSFAQFLMEDEARIALLRGPIRVLEDWRLRAFCLANCGAGYKSSGRDWLSRELRGG
ncbi:tetratricopeptide repeat protein [Roseococcus sp. YIM B11640]|uniref:tetratricopeptide repeat protein n=1 Tax=Roseococcus sp. YIM B11640 TaxID=3133973 RepID=UPI003C7CCE80